MNYILFLIRKKLKIIFLVGIIIICLGMVSCTNNLKPWDNPELVQAVVNRLSMSFHKSLVDPKPTRDLILSKSKKTTPAIHNNALELMKADFLPRDWRKIGCQDPNRWVELANQMKEVNALPADFDPHQSYDTSFKKGCFK